MNPEDIAKLIGLIADNPGTIIAATIPQVVAFGAAWVRIERRITRLETLIDLHFSRDTKPDQRHEDPEKLAARWQRRARP